MYRKLMLISLALPAALFCAGCHSSSTPAASSSTATPSNAPAPSATATATAAPVATQPAPTPGSVTPSAGQPPLPQMVEIPRGTILRVRTTQALGSKISQEGQRFDATLAAPVVIHGHTMIPAGTAVIGTVTQAHASGRFKGGATLGLDLNRIRMNGDSYPIHTALFEEARKGKGQRTAGFIGGGTAGGALIGGLAGGGKGALIGGLIGAGAGTAGAATGNRDITLPSESRLSFQLTQPLSIPLH
ncbi:MAG TPA: hypothetical protein VMD97_11650 [Candidatus Aquilonibacter sp.]|nr:hypothetical protein [Candidatus Aquilonibacter sp.]